MRPFAVNYMIDTTPYQAQHTIRLFGLYANYTSGSNLDDIKCATPIRP